MLSSRLIDRPIRPLLPSHMRNEVQLYVNVLSADTENDPDILAIIGASAALSISTAPFDGPIAAVRIGLKDGEYLVNPTFEALEESRLNLVVAGTDEAVVMVEGSALEISDAEMQKALEIGHVEVRKAIALQRELLSQLEIRKLEIPAPQRAGGARDAREERVRRAGREVGADTREAAEVRRHRRHHGRGGRGPFGGLPGPRRGDQAKRCTSSRRPRSGAGSSTTASVRTGAAPTTCVP